MCGSNSFSRCDGFDKTFLPKAHFTFSPSIIFIINFETGFTSFSVVVCTEMFCAMQRKFLDTLIVGHSGFNKILLISLQSPFILFYTHILFFITSLNTNYYKAKKYEFSFPGAMKGIWKPVPFAADHSSSTPQA